MQLIEIAHWVTRSISFKLGWSEPRVVEARNKYFENTVRVVALVVNGIGNNEILIKMRSSTTIAINTPTIMFLHRGFCICQDLPVKNSRVATV